MSKCQSYKDYQMNSIQKEESANISEIYLIFEKWSGLMYQFCLDASGWGHFFFDLRKENFKILFSNKLKKVWRDSLLK